MVKMDSSSRLLVAIGIAISAAASPARGNGLVLDVRRVSPDRVIVGEPIYVEMTLLNEGREVIVLPYVPFDYQVSWDITGRGGAKASRRGLAVDDIRCDLVNLAPGQAVARTYALTDRYDLLREGIYIAIAHYRAKPCPIAPSQQPGPTNWTGEILARSLTFVIDPLPPGEEKAYRAMKAIHGFSGGSEQCVQFTKDYPNSRFTPYALYWMAEDRLRLKDYAEALAFLRELAAKYPAFPVAELSARRLKECEQALAQRPEVAPKQ